MEFEKILVAIDFGPQADFVFGKALHLAHREGARLKVFHCIGVPNLPLGGSGDIYGQGLSRSGRIQQELLDRDIEAVVNWLQNYQQQAQALQVPTELEYQIGDPGFWIREVGKKWGADLVVLGRRGRSQLAELVLGSVSNHVVHHAKCSVLVVQGMTQEKGDRSDSRAE